ncbi:MAG TPA: polyphosphate kinase 2, partial [Ilumatobacteraceae bacterium]
MAKKNHKNKDHKDRTDQAPDAAKPAKMKNKEYVSELEKLEGELVAMQEWVKASGAKVCIVFEGRDTAGK